VSNVFVLDNTVGPGRLLFIASHGQGPVDDVVISGNVLRGHDLTMDALPPEGERRSNWVITNNISDTVVKHRPMRFFGIDGLVVKNNTQRVTGGDPGVVLTDDCGTDVWGNDFGPTDVVRHGARCAAPLAIPALPAIPGRGGSPGSTTTTTRPHRPTTSGHPRTTRPSTTTQPQPGAPGHSDSGRFVVAVIALVLAAAAIAWLIRRRRSLH
jgi:MYXO-CTERM domain-containing protein